MPNGTFTRSTSTQTSNFNVSRGKDAKTGLGYGVLQPRTQLPRQMGGEFPYIEQEDSGNEELDDDSIDAISKKYQAYSPNDFLRAAGSQPFYFVAGNTKLSDCFWSTGKVLNEIASFGDSMVPVPDLYKNPGPGLSNTGPSFIYPGGGGSNYKRTGTTQGWSHAPPETWLQADESAAEDEEEEIFSLKDLADKILSGRGESLKR